MANGQMIGSRALCWPGAALLVFAAAAAAQEPSGPPQESPAGSRSRRLPAGATEVEGEPLLQVLEQDQIPSIDAPEFVSGDEAEAQMRPEEPVLGVVGEDGTAKCYSLWQLEGHEVVNDELNGRPIAATW